MTKHHRVILKYRLTAIANLSNGSSSTHSDLAMEAIDCTLTADAFIGIGTAEISSNSILVNV